LISSNPPIRFKFSPLSLFSIYFYLFFETLGLVQPPPPLLRCTLALRPNKPFFPSTRAVIRDPRPCSVPPHLTRFCPTFPCSPPPLSQRHVVWLSFHRCSRQSSLFFSSGPRSFFPFSTFARIFAHSAVIQRRRPLFFLMAKISLAQVFQRSGGESSQMCSVPPLPPPLNNPQCVKLLARLFRAKSYFPGSWFSCPPIKLIFFLPIISPWFFIQVSLPDFGPSDFSCELSKPYIKIGGTFPLEPP